MAVMAKESRIRITIDTDDRHKRAFALFAAARGLSVPEAFAALVDEELDKYLSIADQHIAAEKKAPPPARTRG